MSSGPGTTTLPTTLFLGVIVTALAAAACASPPPPEEAPAAPMPATGAGTIVRVDPAFDVLVPPDARIEKLADGFVFTEGPVWVRRGDPHLLFSDLRANAIKQWSPGAGVTDFMNLVFDGDPAGRSVGSNGLAIDADGRLILCEHGNRRVSRIEADGSLTVLADRYDGKRLNSPNDAVYHSSGWLYFTDPPYGLAGQEGDPARELDVNGIYRLSPEGEVELLIGAQSRPNGLGFSPDERILYVANSDANQKVWFAYDVLDDGRLGPGRVFFDVQSETASGAADGLTVDRDGNLFATGPGGVWVLGPDGTHLGTIQPDEVPANAAWGDDGSTLYMTARTGLYRIRLTTSGPIP